MRIRPIEPGDRDGWLRLRVDFWPDHVATHAAEIDQSFEGTLEVPAAVVVAEEDGHLIGFAELSIRPYAEGCLTHHVGYLEGWYVGSPRRGTGVGRALLEACERWARDQGCTEFASDASIDNESSRQAHLACGFDDAGLIRCFSKAL